MLKNFVKFLKKAIYAIKVILVVCFILVEEIVWNKIGEPAYNIVKSLAIMDKFKIWVSDIEHRYLLLFIFLTPFIMMEVLSLVAVKAFAVGAFGLGVTLYVFKIILTVPVAIIFNSAKKTLVSFWIIKYGYGMLLRFKRSKVFRNVKSYLRELKADVRMFFKGILFDEKYRASFFQSLKNLRRKIKVVFRRNMET